MFIKQCERARTRSRQKREQNIASEHTSQPNRCITIPYVQGVSEKIGGVLRREGIKVAYKPIRTINQVFPRPIGSPDETKHRVQNPVQKL